MFAKRLIDLRENKNIFQKDLANILNVEQATVSQWENGKRIPDSETLIKIANYFNVTVDFLIGNDKKGITTFKEQEMKEKEILKKLLVKNGYMKEDEDLSNEELNKIMKFIIQNKEFIKNKKGV